MDNGTEQRQAEQLSAGLAKLDICLTKRQQGLLLAYVALLHKWNRAYNLTAVRDQAQHVSRHLLDSLAMLPHLQGTAFLDVGTGPGLPGIPLAIAKPDSHWILLDSNGKKTRFLTQCQLALELANIEVAHCRLEDFGLPADRRLDGITSRAFATLADFAQGCQHLLGLNHRQQNETLLYALKGVYPKKEMSELPNTYRILYDGELRVPDCDAERHLIILSYQPA